MAQETVHVLIVDDSITYRIILREVLKLIPFVNLAGTASNGKTALSTLAEDRATPIDVVLLDIEMPEMDGLQTLREIKKKYPNTAVVMVSGMNRKSADITIQALEAGALDFVPKPEYDSSDKNIEALTFQIKEILEGYLKTNATKPKRSPAAEPSKTPTKSPEPVAVKSQPTSQMTTQPPPNKGKIPYPFKIIAIGISTGGPKALNELIPHLPNNLNVPIVLVQHMPPVFTNSLAVSLNKISLLEVKEAQEGEILRPNCVYIAPGGKHMVLEKRNNDVCAALNENAPENSCRPAVDVLFRSVAAVYQKNVLSLVMTGMGNDGALGTKAIKAAGGYSITQSAESCVIYGMPKAVDDLDLSDERVDLVNLAPRITALLKNQGKTP
ncbi:MAG: chemotaxis response regulator protein-glutamate methylesterase [Cyanobacteria bacterium]|nr:chemotaxis response regulator protein-glutamate methylesterase [Cyanobacteriota bacterium]